MGRSLKLAGVDPGILRELSGIYTPFVKAFKEMISNAYDADADAVRIRLSDNYNQLEILDDGIGMTPFEFRSEFAKLGGSKKKVSRTVSKKGRRKIGSKGIGFLAVARYCGLIEIISTTLRKHRGKIHHKGHRTTLDLIAFFEVPIPCNLLSGRLKITSLTLVTAGKRKQLRSSDFVLASSGRVRIIKNKKRAYSSDMIEIRYSLDCRSLEFKAVIDYDYLLSLENKRDLSQLSDFCVLDVYPLEKNDERVKQQYTRITLRGLKDFVIRDLKAPKKSGRVRNVESDSGLERFVWHLRRCTPIKYDLPTPIQEMFGGDNLESRRIKAINRPVFSGPGREDLELRRPVWGGNPEREWVPGKDISMPVKIDQEGLRARGYILGHSEAVFPAEYRGIAIRVRNVQIGAPGFFGLEQTLTGASRAMLSQITGEINVFDGLDATDALNPGRDSFYEENLHYKILRRHIVGDGEAATGLLGVVIKGMLERLQVLSAVESNLSRANNYRSALLNLSMAINHYGTNSNGGVDLRGFFADSLSANGLSEREDYDVLPGPRVAGFRVKAQPELEQEHFIDFGSRTVYFNFKHERWSNRIFVLGQHYEVAPKMGSSSDPLCEIDTAERKVYINWGHPLRQQMGDVAFLKSSVAWKLSYHACRGNIEAMMDLALNLLTFNGV
ncbi:MAG TPA: ATP-binding protein [Pyrinomonadaceae bacterium]|nr:ATP-binding protein [Pyrinomonadaceae bacterium]